MVYTSMTDKNLFEKLRFHSTIPALTVKNPSYPELLLFKNQIELDGNGTSPRPYSTAKSTVFVYRSIFVALGLLFFILGSILYFKSLTWSITLFFGSTFMVKTLICSICAASSLYCLGLGVCLTPTKESVRKTFANARTRLKGIYDRKVVQHGVKNYYLFGTEFQKSKALWHTYHESVEKLHDLKEEAYHLILRISTSSYPRNEKEELYNQAILEFRDKMNIAIDRFRNANPQKQLS